MDVASLLDDNYIRLISVSHKKISVGITPTRSHSQTTQEVLNTLELSSLIFDSQSWTIIRFSILT